MSSPVVPSGLAPPPACVLPEVLIRVTGAGQLQIQSTIPSPGAWAQITALLLAAAQAAHEHEVAEAQQAGQGSLIVVPQGVVVG